MTPRWPRPRAYDRCLMHRPTAEKVRALDLGVEWSDGSPRPKLIHDVSQTFLVVELREDRDDGARTGVLRWLGVVAVAAGFPNEEARPPSTATAYEVLDSPWLTGVRAAERTHPRASKVPFANVRHFRLLFHDSTFDILAESVRVTLDPRSQRTLPPRSPHSRGNEPPPCRGAVSRSSTSDSGSCARSADGEPEEPSARVDD